MCSHTWAIKPVGTFQVQTIAACWPGLCASNMEKNNTAKCWPKLNLCKPTVLSKQKGLQEQQNWLMYSKWSGRQLLTPVEASKGKETGVLSEPARERTICYSPVKMGPVSVWFPGRVPHSELLTLLLEAVVCWSVVRWQSGDARSPTWILLLSQVITFSACHFEASPTFGSPLGKSILQSRDREHGMGRLRAVICSRILWLVCSPIRQYSKRVTSGN